MTLDNTTPKGYRMEVGAVVTADAVRFGGGMGNIARRRYTDPSDSVSFAEVPYISGLPRSAEAARYWLQWAGADSTVYYQQEGKDDYKDDFMSRGDWVEWVSRGSRVNPSGIGGLGIPIDLSIGFHSDAGVTPNDSLIGTLAIYTYKSEGKTTLPAGEDRLTSRMFADIVQTQIVNDLREQFDTLWARRCIWDRAYRESRTPSCPAMLLELLSHQNFADMKYGLDPSFRFAVGRSVYKGVLKYLSNRFGCEYIVQPLPVRNLAVDFGEAGKAVVSWEPVEDPMEPTAQAKGYTVYKRIGEGEFDYGTVVTNGKCSFEVDIVPGKVNSFKVVAWNEGGRSFPSETVSIGIPATGIVDSHILIVNNFDRVSGPAWFDSGERAGFDNRTDSGVPHMKDITFVGEMYNFRRSEDWVSNARPGFGASYTDMAGEVVAGNTFDYPSIHGKAMLSAGYAFCSCSNERFEEDASVYADAWAIDLICGKQITTPVGMHTRYTVFNKAIQNSINNFVSKGGNIFVSGSYIGTDLKDRIYPVDRDSTACVKVSDFAEDVLGYRFVTGQAGRRGTVKPVANRALSGLENLRFETDRSPDIYCVESPDGIAPANADGQTICRYSDSGISAGVAYQGKGYKAVSLGFPIETLKEEALISNVIRTILEYFKK